MEQIVLKMDGKVFKAKVRKVDVEKFSIRVNNNYYLVKVNSNDINKIYINEKPIRVELLKKYSNSVYSFIVNQTLVQLDIDTKSRNCCLVTINGFTHTIELTNEIKQFFKIFFANNETEIVKKLIEVRTPVSGIIIKILTEDNAYVNKGEKIILIEDSNMEIALGAPISGIIKSIIVSEGNVIDKGSLLFEIEIS